MLDPRGTQVATESSPRRCPTRRGIAPRFSCFAIVGPFLHAPATRTRAWREVALSRRLNHDSRGRALEQLYRVTDILWVRKVYHH